MGHSSTHLMTSTAVICLTVFSVMIQKKDNVNAAIQLTATPYLQTFVSHDTYNGTTYYPEGGYSREWLITGQTGNYTITIEVIECVLEIQKGVCLFDYIFVYDGISNTCLDCICDVESNCNKEIGCADDGGSDSCGPFQIKKVYWIDCYRPGNSYEECTKDYDCAKGCVQTYMNRYGGRKCGTTCEDYARMHNGGPRGCKKSATNAYWDKIKLAGCSRNS